MKKMLLACMVFTLSFLGCSQSQNVRTIKQQYASGVFSVEEATEVYGEPDGVVKQGDGLTRHSWVYHEEHQTPDRVYYFRQRDSLFSEERVIKGKRYQHYCFFNIYTDDMGVVKGTSWDGNACDRLKEVKQTRSKTNLLPEKESMLHL